MNRSRESLADSETESYSESDEDADYSVSTGVSEDDDRTENEDWDSNDESEDVSEYCDYSDQDGDDTDDVFFEDQYQNLSKNKTKCFSYSNSGQKREYRLLCSDGDAEAGFNMPSQYENSLKAIWAPPPMSPVRRAFFLATIMFGILVFSVFLWVLPCDVQPCEPKIHILPHPWLIELDGIGVNYTELIEKVNGDLSIFHSYYMIESISDDASRINSSYEDNKLSFKPVKCGLLSLNEKDGKESWRVDINECPRSINCSLIDVTGDGIKDCMVLGHRSMALMIEPVYGIISWHISFQRISEGIDDSGIEYNKPFNIDFVHFGDPMVMEDFDGDDFPELLFTVQDISPASTVLTNEGLREHSLLYFVLVSGRTGSIIGQPFNLSNAACLSVKLLSVVERASILYSCLKENDKEKTKSISLPSLLSHFGVSFIDYSAGIRDESLEVIEMEESLSPIESICLIRFVNQGSCPKCFAEVQYGDDLEMSKTISKFDQSSIISWKVLAGSNGLCNAVLLKIWKWNVNNKNRPLSPKRYLTTPKQINAPSDYSNSIIDIHSQFAKPLKFLADFLNGRPENQEQQELELQSDNYGAILQSDMITNSSDVLSPSFYHDKHDENSQSQHFSLRKHPRGGRDLVEFTYNSGVRSSLPLSESKLKREINEFTEESKLVARHKFFGASNVKINSSASSNFSMLNSSEHSLKSKIVLPAATIGYRVQELEEALFLYKFNGSVWIPYDLGSILVVRMCNEKICFPSFSSQVDSSIMVDEASLLSPQWNFYIMSSTFSPVFRSGNNGSTPAVNWVFESYIRKFIFSPGF